MSWSWKKDLKKSDKDDSAWAAYSVQDMLLLESALVDKASKPNSVVTLSNKEHCVDITKMIQFRLDVRWQSISLPTHFGRDIFHCQY